MKKSDKARKSTVSRRDLVKGGGALAAAYALGKRGIPQVHAATDNTIRLALIGTGGRGSGAASNAMSAPSVQVKLVAMADIQEKKLSSSYDSLKERHGDQVDVPRKRRFLGFDAYREAIDCLRPGDVALLTTHAYIRPTHFEYAVEKGVNVFMEKSFAADPGGLQRILRASKRAEKKNLKVATGLMCRHSSARQALIQKIREGAIGDVQLVRAYRMGNGPARRVRPKEISELMWQIGGSVYDFFWTSGGTLVDWLIHNIDECCWIMDSPPAIAHGFGGREPKSDHRSQNFHAYSVEYTFPNGSTALVGNRFTPNCYSDFATYVHGTKCGAQFSGDVHRPTVQIYKDQRLQKEDIVWQPENEVVSPYQQEWNDLIDAIRNDKPYNEVERSVNSNMAALMGRAAVHSGQRITWDEMMKSEFRFCPNVDKLDYDSPAPVQADEDGFYPVPMPGKWKEI